MIAASFSRWTMLLAILATLGDSVSAVAQDNDFRLRHTPQTFDQFVDRRRQIEQDLANQERLLEARRAELQRWNAADQQAFQSAFGTTDEATRQQIQQTIDRELSMNSRMTANSFQESPISRPGRYAYVYPNNDSTIYLDDQYFASPPTGQDSRAGTIVHEMSHFNSVAGTRDYVYGANNAANLATNYATNNTATPPVQNADNVEYYVEGALRQPPAARRTEFSPSAAPHQTAHAPDAQAEQMMREQAAANAYNPAAAYAGTQNADQFTGRNRLVMDENASQAVATEMRNRDDATTSPQTPEPEMTQEQFRVEVARQMQRLQVEYDRQRQELMQRQLPESSPAEPVALPNQPQPVSQPARPQTTYASRNGYDAYGNRADSPRQPLDAQGSAQRPRTNRVYGSDGSFQPTGQYDEQGYSSQPRQNRVYGTDGSSRPIGNSGFAQAQQQFQREYQQSQAQIGAIQSGRSQAGGRTTSNGVNAPSSATNVPSTSQSPSRVPAARQTIVYDENATRSTPTQVVPRQSGSSAATASLDFFPK